MGNTFAATLGFSAREAHFRLLLPSHLPSHAPSTHQTCTTVLSSHCETYHSCNEYNEQAIRMATSWQKEIAQKCAPMPFLCETPQRNRAVRARNALQSWANPTQRENVGDTTSDRSPSTCARETATFPRQGTLQYLTDFYAEISRATNSRTPTPACAELA